MLVDEAFLKMKSNDFCVGESRHFLMAARTFGTNYVWKSNRKKRCPPLDMPDENGWLGSLNGTGHLTVYCLSPSQCTGVISIRSHISPAGNEDVLSNGKHNDCGQMEDISL